jgi:hypothetical protein
VSNAIPIYFSWSHYFAFRLLLIGANVAEFLRSLDEAALVRRLLFAGPVMVAEAIDLLACHLGCLALAFRIARMMRGGGACEAAFHQATDGLETR